MHRIPLPPVRGFWDVLERCWGVQDEPESAGTLNSFLLSWQGPHRVSSWGLNLLPVPLLSLWLSLCHIFIHVPSGFVA